MALAEQFGWQPYSEFHARFGQGVTHALRGDFALAVATLEPAMEIARNAGLAVMASSGEIYLGYAYLLGGDTARAVENLEEALLKSDQLATLAFHLYARGLLAEAYLASGKIDQARRLGETALELCRNHNQQGYEAEVLYSLGTIYAAGTPAEAEHGGSCYQDALAKATDLRMRALIARCRLSLAELCWKREERELAREHLNSAAAMFSEMNMQFWLKKTDAVQSQIS
jgi:tetratricopeptide (TPR) repeat protein